MSSAAKTGEKNTLYRDITVQNRQGIHARPSASFVKLASQFNCEVFIEKDGETINGKSLWAYSCSPPDPEASCGSFAPGPTAKPH